MTDQPMLNILLLGAPSISIEDQPLQIQRRLLRWMLYFLACQKDMVGRSDLILLFWPDEPEEDGRRHLREMLSKLRAQLPNPNLIITEQDRVSLDFRGAFSDVLEFQTLYGQTARICAQTPAATPLTQAVHQQVMRAVRLWRSPRFLAGASLPESESLNDWLLSTSQQLEIQHQRLLERLVDHDIATGDVESAIQWLRSALEGDETNESLHYQLLNLLYNQNRYSEALNHCAYVQELFQRDGYEELPPSLLRLSRQIREESAHPTSESDRPSWPSLADIQVPFVGRQTLLQELQFAVRRGSPVMLFGEAGSGKSRLVRELFFSLKPAPRLLLAPARAMETSLRYQPIIDMLRHDIQAEEWKQVDRAWVAPLSLLLPELTYMRPDIQPVRVAPEQERSLIFESLRQLLVFLGKKQRFMLFLDNAQWSDADSLSALAYLAERGLTEGNGALILAARPEEITPHLSRFLNRPRSEYSLQRLELPPLEEEEISTLARYVLGDAFTQAIIPRLERETGGNPLFLLETLRLVLDYSFSSRQHTASEPLPLASTIYGVIRDRLQHLSPTDSQVLGIAAVIGSEFSTDIIETTSMLPAEQVAQSLDSLAQVNLIQAVLKDRPSGEYTFVHEKVREVILLDLSPARKRLFHLRIARALDQKQQGQSADMEARLASHYEEAGELVAAFQHYLQTSPYAWRVNDREMAITALERAEQILQRLGNQASDISIYQLYRQWGRLANDLGDAEMMEQVYHRLLAAGQERQNPLLAGGAYNGLAQVAELRMHPENGLAYLNKAAPFLEQTGRLFERIEARNHRGVFEIQTGQFIEAQSTFQKALAAAERANDAQSVEARSIAEYWQSMLLSMCGWPLLAKGLAEKSLEDAGQVFFHFGAARATNMLAITELHLGHYQEGLALARHGIELAQAGHFSFLVGELHGTIARACLVTGDLDGCWEHAQTALKIAREYPFGNLEEGMQLLLGQLFTFLGCPAQGRECFRANQKPQLTSFANYSSIENDVHLALALANEGDTETAIETINRCIVAALQNGLMLAHLLAQVAMAYVLVRTGQPGDVAQILDFTQAESQQRTLPEIEIRSMLVRARLMLLRGQDDQAWILFREAAAAANKIQNIFLEIHAQAIWVEAARQANTENQANLANSLSEKLHTLMEHTKNPELHSLLTTMKKSVDRIS